MSNENMNHLLSQAMRQQVPGGVELELPPKSIIDMEAEMVAYEPGQSLTVRFPVLERYHNPMKMMQGGFIVAAIDNTIGPLAYLVAPPSVTTQLNTSFTRPVTPDNKYIVVEARVTAQTRRQLFLSAHVTNMADKLVAIGQAVHTVIDLLSD
jgi:uncharacterized protein (TIGR00369 family)